MRTKVKYWAIFATIMSLAALFVVNKMVSVDRELEDAIVTYKIGNYQEAKKLLEPLATEGKSDAHNTLAIIYAFGLGTERERRKAMMHLNNADRDDAVETIKYIIWVFENGETDVEQNIDESIYWNSVLTEF